MRKFNSIVVLFGLLVLPALVVGSVLPPTAQQLNNHKLALSFEQPKANNNNDTDHKIVGGVTAPEGAFPYMVSLRRNGQHFCGGSIISPEWILTAAHCVYGTGPAGLTAVVGTNTLNQGGVAYPAFQIISHQSYDPQTTINDIALIRLATTIQYSSTIQPIALVSANPVDGSTTTLSGWGLTSYPGGIPNALQYINLQTLDLQSCAAYLQGASPITNGHVCTTSPANYGGCQGDSGGPLMQYGNQVGIVSWGIPCAKGYPDVYTSVAFYRDWILSNTRIIL